MHDAAVMSFCSALKHLDEFGWTEWGSDEEQDEQQKQLQEQQDELSQNTTEPQVATITTTEKKQVEDEDEQSYKQRIRAFTILRHPVERVWSMYRFQTRICYKCMKLTDIYDTIDNNITYVTVRNHSQRFDDLCLDQLRNHEVANLLTSTHWPDHPEDEETQQAMVAEAIQNMKEYFTVIGLTEELTTTAQIIGKVMPWMNETLEGFDDACPLPHDNSSPTNNRCIYTGRGKPDEHWDLPKHPDEETRQAILKHNTMDMQLYEAAVAYFELQKRAMEWGTQQ